MLSVWTVQISDIPAASARSESLSQSASVPSCSVRCSRPATQWWVLVQHDSGVHVRIECFLNCFKFNSYSLLCLFFFIIRWMLPGSTWTAWQTHVPAAVEATVNVSAPVWRRTPSAAVTRVFLLTGAPLLCAVSQNAGWNMDSML